MSKTKKKNEKIGLVSRRGFIGGSAATLASAVFGTAKTMGAGSTASTSSNEIVSARIHPAIGVARVGNSNLEDGYSIGPEVTNPPLTRPGEMRDLTGAIKRQAARFRVYGLNAAGEVVAEITSDMATIEWQVHLANKKAAWYRFEAALDLNEAKDLSVTRRNPLVFDNRRALVIDPGPRRISGANSSGVKFDTGKFHQESVYLGELKCDHKGRLVVLGGKGYSNSFPRKQLVFNPSVLETFNNADGWFDDISDGPVTASVNIKGISIPVEPSWVIVGPPNFAPDMISWRTAYEMLNDCFITQKMKPAPATTSFYKDVLPILQRLSRLQWVNQGFAQEFGKGGKIDFEDPSIIARLADKSEVQFRRQVFERFRLPTSQKKDATLWPMMYGDGFGTFNEGENTNFIVGGTHGLHLRRWMSGNYDLAPAPAAPRRLSDVPLADQPAMLDHAALHFCLADAFHPGCEITWPMRHATMYSSPFRIKHRPANTSEINLGATLTHANVRTLAGPLYAQGPGDITRWMAVPWQGDTIFCRSGYDPDFNPYIPSYWPARVPNHVLTEADYAIVTSPDNRITRAERIEAFKRRRSWFRSIRTDDPGDLPGLIERTVTNFSDLGIIEARPGFANDPDFPPVIFVESRPVTVRDTVTPVVVAAPESAEFPESARGGGGIGSAADVEPNYEKAGFESLEQAKAFRRIKGLAD